mmetsp:Transcript_12732/g.32602  ORF Transcript_12732/g.32602 Transcript_12732/m.32602 type:complete len:288 (+) Transcript_12732:1533-2396(+)
MFSLWHVLGGVQHATVADRDTNRGIDHCGPWGCVCLDQQQLRQWHPGGRGIGARCVRLQVQSKPGRPNHTAAWRGLLPGGLYRRPWSGVRCRNTDCAVFAPAVAPQSAWNLAVREATRARIRVRLQCLAVGHCFWGGSALPPISNATPCTRVRALFHCFLVILVKQWRRHRVAQGSQPDYQWRLSSSIVYSKPRKQAAFAGTARVMAGPSPLYSDRMPSLAMSSRATCIPPVYRPGLAFWNRDLTTSGGTATIQLAIPAIPPAVRMALVLMAPDAGVKASFKNSYMP